MANNRSNRIKPTETELKEKLVNLNRVAKVTKGDVLSVLLQS